MALSHYELGYILKPDMSIDENNAVQKKLQSLIKKFKGSVLETDQWERRKLAYPIQHIQFGVYVFMIFQIEASGISELNRTLHIQETILRYLITKLDSRELTERKERAEKLAEQKAAEAKREAEMAAQNAAVADLATTDTIEDVASLDETPPETVETSEETQMVAAITEDQEVIEVQSNKNEE